MLHFDFAQCEDAARLRLRAMADGRCCHAEAWLMLPAAALGKLFSILCQQDF